MKGKTFVVVLAVLSLFLVPFVVAAEEKVVLYSAHTQEIIDAMVPRFEAATGIKAEVVKLGSSDVIARIKAEGQSPVRCDLEYWWRAIGGKFGSA